jgi:hypothetical protein
MSNIARRVHSTATDTGEGVVERATNAEVVAGTDTTRYAAPDDIAKVVQSGGYVYAADAEASDTYVISMTPTLAAYTTGMEVNFKANTANTGAATLNIDSLGAKTIVKRGASTLADNDIKAGQIVTVVYDGTNFQMQSQLGNAPSGSGDMVLADVQVVTGLKTFGTAGGAVSKFALAGSTSGSTVVDASAVASGTITVPAATDTLVGKATTDTLTNKTFDANGTGNSLSNVETADIASGSKSGSDTTLVTGTKGTNGQVGEWNADGDLVGVSTYGKIQRYRTFYIDAGAMLASTTNGATAATKEYTTNDLDFDYFAFATGADSHVQWKMPMPDDWDRSTIKAKFYWSTATSTSAADSITWAIQAVALGDSDTIDAAWGTAVTREDAVLAADGADMQVSAASTAITVGGSPAGIGEMVAFRVFRDVSADTVPEDIWLFGVQIQYQTLTTEPSAW